MTNFLSASEELTAMRKESLDLKLYSQYAIYREENLLADLYELRDRLDRLERRADTLVQTCRTHE